MTTLFELLLWALALAGFWRLRHRPALVLALVLPWLALLLLAGLGRQERYWWLWAGLAIPLMSAVVQLPGRARIVAFAALFGVVCVAPVFVESALGNETLLTRWRAVVEYGYGGPEMPGYQAARALGEDLQAHGITETRIGYDIPAWGFEAPYHALDQRYKVGMQYDLLLRLVYGVTNTARAADGREPGALTVAGH